MRQILQETGTPLAGGDSAKVGTHPNMAKAIAKIMELREDEVQDKPVAVAGQSFAVTATSDSSRAYPLDASASKNAVSYRWTISKGAGTFWLQEKQAGGWVRHVDGPTARALIPASTEGEVTYRLTVKGKDGTEDFSDITVKVNKANIPDIPGDDASAYNPRIPYPVKCTRVSHNGQVWLNQWYLNAGQEEPGKGGLWGAWGDASN
jgi:hypothetical protein